MLLDPRPYNYEYRKPRIQNPTFQSSSLHRSVFNSQTSQTDYSRPDRYGQKGTQYFSQSLDNRKRNYSTDLKPVSKLDPAISRGSSSVQLPSLCKEERPRAVSNNDKQPYFKAGFERFRVYQHQQKPYNIISYCPRDTKSNKLRNYPKLTLQNRLIERDAYRTFDKQPI